MADDEFDDAELDRFKEWLEEWLTASFNERATEILARIDEVEAQPIGDGQVILLGTEGQVDYVWSVPDPLPDTLRAAIPSRPTAFVGDPTDVTVRTATYHRVGRFTYQREPIK